MAQAKGLEIMAVHDYSVKISISFDWISIQPFAFELRGQNASGKAKDTNQLPQQMQAQVTVG